MTPDSTLSATDATAALNWIPSVNTIIATLASLTAILVPVLTQFIPWYRKRRIARLVSNRVGADLYPPSDVEQATRYYIEPDCQSVDPAGAEEQRLVMAVKTNVFKSIDDVFNRITQHRYIILLADSGMGKSSFLLNY